MSGGTRPPELSAHGGNGRPATSGGTGRPAGDGGAGRLEVADVVKAFGANRAVDGVSFVAEAGRITGLIGPNGAGKTTLFNAVAGEYPLDAGSVRLDGEQIGSLPPYRVFSHGLARTFQIPRPFGGMTVLENVMCVPERQAGERFWNSWLRPGLVAREERRNMERAREIIEFCGLTKVERQLAGAISGGQQKLVELARALMADPKIVLLDEPGAGVNPALLDTIVDRIVELNKRGLSFLIIEHNMDFIMSLCDHIVVMATGRVIAEGEPDTVIADPQVIDAYLGGAIQ
ncbi:ABC transporter ATP-binding protein [Nitratireductor pacificus]|uniref:Branched chain amino acid ABC transporter ATP-binding protein n=1 Tax=Nitratireductor pacificus pht-3B TaxID=391937 RepID=K2M8Y1_9HYPH|nr:ABC transporter ATP-binding protein [Nitratireductor pacificus]EKF18586.1 branched chain amino acid ABC transporter ATP-binding protein [Nitratireductor pacificus pht-3B]